MKIIKNFFKFILVSKMESAFDNSYKEVNKVVRRYLKENPLNKTPRVLDIGCGSGEIIKKYLIGVKDSEIYGLDIERPVKNKKIIFKHFDFEDAEFPFKNDFFDIVICGQTIEHLLNKDKMLEESHRVLRKGGLFVCATENISSFDNIFSLILGQEPLCQNTGAKYNTTSIISPNFMRKMGPNGNKYHHKNVTSYYGLLRLFRVNGFHNPKIKSFGNVLKFFEFLFPIYNRVVVVWDVK